MATARPRSRRTFWSGPRRDTRGVAALEFAILWPVILLLTLGALDMGFIAIVDASLEMAVREAARFGVVSTNAEKQTRDQAIEQAVNAWMDRWQTHDSTLTISMRTYEAFDNIGEPEPFSDDNGNGTWDDGEEFTDLNGDLVWNADMGTAGAGGREEIVLYEVDFVRPHLTGITTLVGWNRLHFNRRIVVQNE